MELSLSIGVAMRGAGEQTTVALYMLIGYGRTEVCVQTRAGNPCRIRQRHSTLSLYPSS